MERTSNLNTAQSNYTNILQGQSFENKTPIEWAAEACLSLMRRYPHAGDLPPAGRWHYHQGVFLYGMLQLWERTGEQDYLAYIKSYADHLIDERGNLLFQRDELDAIQAGILLFELDAQYPDPRYRIAADKLKQLFLTLNRTKEGGFWHKDKYPYQMWLDGLFMGGVFAMKYAHAYHEEQWREMALVQEALMRRYMYDPKTKLYFHAWDEKRETAWADPLTGCSPELWGRSLGWYGIAIADMLELLPDDHQSKPELAEVLAGFVEAIIDYQDQDSGLWYQVVDKGDREDNWLETSCSSLFVYAIAKAIKLGCIPEDAIAAARVSAKAGYIGLLNRLSSDSLGIIVPEICIGTSAGDYEHYVSRPTCENDLHGVGAFVLACTAIHDIDE